MNTFLKFIIVLFVAALLSINDFELNIERTYEGLNILETSN